MVLASSPEMIEDIRKAPDDVLSLTALLAEVRMFPRRLGPYSQQSCQSLQVKYTLDLLEPNNTFSIDVIRWKLTRNIATTFEEVRDELVRSLDACIPMCGDGTWKI